MGVVRGRSKARPPASWPRPLTKSPNSPSRLGHLGELLSPSVCLCVCFRGRRVLLSATQATSVPPGNPLETPQLIRPAEEPEPRRPREIALSRPRPPPGPAPAGLPRGFAGGRGRLPAWEQTPKPARSLPPEALPHLSPPLCCPPRPPGRTAAPRQAGVGPRRRGGPRSRHRR